MKLLCYFTVDQDNNITSELYTNKDDFVDYMGGDSIEDIFDHRMDHGETIPAKAYVDLGSRKDFSVSSGLYKKEGFFYSVTIKSIREHYAYIKVGFDQIDSYVYFRRDWPNDCWEKLTKHKKEKTRLRIDYYKKGMGNKKYVFHYEQEPNI